MAIKHSAAASIVCMAVIVWKRKILLLLPDSSKQLKEGTNRFLNATFFRADATLVSLIFSTRVMTLAVAARKNIWLQTMLADVHLKAIVMAFSLQGDKIFGDCLDKYCGWKPRDK